MFFVLLFFSHLGYFFSPKLVEPMEEYLPGMNYGETFEIQGPRTHLVFRKSSQGLEFVEGCAGRAYAHVCLENNEVCVEADDAGACYPVHGVLVIGYDEALGMIKNPLLMWELLHPLMEIEEDDWRAWRKEIDAWGRYRLPENPETRWAKILGEEVEEDEDEWELEE